MMTKFFWNMIGPAMLATVFLAAPAWAQNERASFGGDEFAAGNQATLSSPIGRDAFAAGFNVLISGPVAGDAHAAGYSVTIGGDVEGDAYAAGNTVIFSGKIGQDLSAAAASISITGDGGVGGNVRAAGANVLMAKPVAGSVAIGAASATIDGKIDGDLFFSGETISFTNKAIVLGSVTIRATSDVSVPASVATSDRVSVEKIESAQVIMEAGEIAQHSVKGFWPIWLPILISLAVLLVAGIVWLALFTKTSLFAYKLAMAKPWKSFALGILSMAAFFGLTPVIAMTVLGIPLVPITLIALVIAGVLGFIAGAWIAATRIMSAFGYGSETLGKRVVALFVGVIFGWALGLIPLLGWLIHLALAFIGLGAISFAALGPRFDQAFLSKLSTEVATTPTA